MRFILTARRHGVALQPGETLPTERERQSAVARGRRALAKALVRRFPQAKIHGVAGTGELLVEIPDDDPGLKDRIRAELDCETGPDPDAPKTGPVWNDIAPTPEAVAEAHAGKAYRPTVVAMVRDARGRLLLVQSRFNPDEWMLVQGGIEQGEKPPEALARELREEIGVEPDDITAIRYVGTADLDAESGRVDKRGFTKGKRYFVYEVAYRGPDLLTLQAEELAGYAWVEARFDDPALLERLGKTREAKCMLIIGALIRLLA